MISGVLFFYCFLNKALYYSCMPFQIRDDLMSCQDLRILHMIVSTEEDRNEIV